MNDYEYGDKVRVKATSLDPAYCEAVKRYRDLRIIGEIVSVSDSGREFAVGFPSGEAFLFPIGELERVEPAPAPPDVSLAVDVAREALKPFADAWQQYQASDDKGRSFWAWAQYHGQFADLDFMTAYKALAQLDALNAQDAP